MSEPTIKDEIFIWLDNNYINMGYNPTIKGLAEEFDMSNEESISYFREWMWITYVSKIAFISE